MRYESGISFIKPVRRLVLRLLFVVFLVGRPVWTVFLVSFPLPMVFSEEFPLGQLEFPALVAPLALSAHAAQEGIPHLLHPPLSLRMISLLVRLFLPLYFPPLSASSV